MHEGRHYKKLSPVFHCHQVILGQFIEDFWDYYRELLAYKNAPSPEAALLLRSKFRRLFETQSGYESLDERKQLTATKVSELLRVLEHPELPLHNNPAELAARTMVQRRNISYATQTIEGTRAIDTFMSLVATKESVGNQFLRVMCVTEFLNLELFPLYVLLFAKNLLFILWDCLGNQINCYPYLLSRYDMRIIVYEPGTRITNNYHCGSEAIKLVASSLGKGLAKK